MADILIIDDDLDLSRLLARWVTDLGYRAEAVNSLAEGLAAVKKGGYDVILLDLILPDGNGLDQLPVIGRAPGRPEVIIITGGGDSESARLAYTNGAWDYLTKPIDQHSLALSLDRALRFREEKGAELKTAYFHREEIIGRSDAMDRCLKLVALAAPTDVSVLITGETGSGKELLARAIHRNSPRRNGSFIVIDCASIPHGLAESILFGHVRGAFTGADKSQPGLIREAHGGTLFLDEIGEMPLETQTSFLRVLQEKNFRPVGSTAEVTSDFRVVAATNRDLDRMVDQGAFRPELLYRLQSAVIEAPPLRDRPGDVKDIAVHWVTRLCENFRQAAKSFTPEFLELLQRYDWPGNVRELINTMERAIMAAGDGPTLYPIHLPASLRAYQTAPAQEPDDQPLAPVSGETAALPPLKEYRQACLEAIEKQYLDRLIDQTGGAIEQACLISGLSQSRLYALLKKHGVSR